MDNGSGSALVLDMAASFKKNPEKLRRSILLVLRHRRRKGLARLEVFRRSSHGPAEIHCRRRQRRHVSAHRAAEVAHGARSRRLRSWAIAPARSRNRSASRVQPDPEPLRNLFIRSDQYNFIRHGVPSLIMSVAPEPGSPEVEDFQRLADPALSRALGRRGPTGRPRRRRQIRRDRQSFAHQHRQRRPSPRVEAR